jgi:LacI family transcriptional regulator
MKRVSLRDIAKESGVSLKTVSRILSGDVDSHRPETCAVVQDVAARLNYRPNLAAGAVFGRATRTVGIMIPFADDGDFYGRIVKGAHDELVRSNYAPILVLSTPELDLRQQIHSLIDRRVDGILVRPMYERVDEVLLEEVLGRRLPLVIVMRPTEMTGKLDFVGADEYAMGTMAGRHLLERGHRNTAFIGVDSTEKPWPETVTGQRWRGFRDVLRAAGGSSVLACQDRSVAQPIEMVCDLLRLTPRPTAIFAATDRLALDTYAAAARLGLRVPQDLSVIGCGNLVYGAHMTPPLTTCDSHPEQMGAAAAACLIDRIEKKRRKPVELRIQPTLVERASVGRV